MEEEFDLMTIFAHSAVYAMAAEIYRPEEARRFMPRYYGFAEANVSSPQGEPDGENWIDALSRRVSAIFAASVAAMQRL
jgi:hypothetical protein